MWAEINITSMMDMMTIILCFLLKSFSTTDVSVAPSPDLRLPTSSAAEDVALAVNVVVAKNRIVVDGDPVLTLDEVADPAAPGVLTPAVAETDKRGQLVLPLYDVLLEKARLSTETGERIGHPDYEFSGRILLQVDRDMPFSVVREVMYTAGQAQFGEFRFVVYKAE